MNYDNLHELISRYEDDLDNIYGTQRDELFKWRAMKTWQEEWFKADGSFASFADRFNASRKDFSLFMDNSRMHPSSGVIKLWEKEPETVEHLFYDVLFADPKGSVSVVQDNMDTFLDEYEALRQRHCPGNWSYKQDRHSASVFLALYDPSFNFVYKSSEALTMARYIDFRSTIGAGSYFSLEHYYQLCEEILKALNEHPSLLDKHFARLSNRCYIDKSLHLLAFDLMYCSRTYNYYKGLVLPVIFKTVNKPTEINDSGQREKERLAKIESIRQEIEMLEQSEDGCEDISLIGVQVSSGRDGIGMVVEQNINKITVQFEKVKKSFVLDKKYAVRPRFENDETIVEAFTKYGSTQERIRTLRRQMEALQKK